MLRHSPIAYGSGFVTNHFGDGSCCSPVDTSIIFCLNCTHVFGGVSGSLLLASLLSASRISFFVLLFVVIPIFSALSICMSMSVSSVISQHSLSWFQAHHIKLLSYHKGFTCVNACASVSGFVNCSICVLSVSSILRGLFLSPSMRKRSAFALNACSNASWLFSSSFSHSFIRCVFLFVISSRRVALSLISSSTCSFTFSPFSLRILLQTTHLFRVLARGSALFLTRVARVRSCSSRVSRISWLGLVASLFVGKCLL